MKFLSALALLPSTISAAAISANPLHPRQYGLARTIVTYAPGTFPTVRTESGVFLTVGRCQFALTGQCILTATCVDASINLGTPYTSILGGSNAYENTFCSGVEYGELIFQPNGEFYIVRYVGGVTPRPIWLTYTDQKGVAYLEIGDTTPYIRIIGNDGFPLYEGADGSPPPGEGPGGECPVTDPICNGW